MIRSSLKEWIYMTEKLSTEYEQRLLQVKQNYDYIMARIAEAAEKSGRKPEDIKFLAATKTVSYDIINYAISLGLKYIGENKVQELNSKYDDYKLGDCELHLIGHLQTNKVKQIVGKVSMIQSVDSIKLAKEIGGAKAAKELGIPEGTIHTWLKAVRTGQLDIGEGAHTPESAMSLAEELTMLRKRVKDQDKEIRRLKEENEFLEEASAFFAASRRKSLRPKE